ncbi:metallo-beta-lactamase superfamily protein [Myriangium duriaei CBS 260.36]|uniref:Metallo-beta-lactamase superfamily protein n=1 Tax=Myriangium duriaei CBS 260.36 TaxID=1168546 RepID=A0A9P4J4P3_9PEZI|nr:metallo-beta-lactamase superfamily protein [Myriangium duriaei CBS 260.36]
MFRKMASSLVSLPEVERLSPRVIRILGGNPGKYTLQGTNTYLVGTGKSRLLLDTGEGKPAWAISLKKVLDQENASIERTILTHWHHDHVGGIQDVLALSPNCPIHKNRPDQGQSDIEDGQTFETEGATLRAFFSPGHTVDHMAFVLDEENAMFTGDNVLGQGTAVFEDLKTYMDSLEKMQSAFSGRAYPGHGPVLEDGKAKVQEYIKHRMEREQQILGVLNDQPHDRDEGWTSMEMVKVIYKDYPEHLHGPAEGSVMHVLKKLEREGRATQDGKLWSLVSKERL